MNVFRQFSTSGSLKCLLITSPILECGTFYGAMPILTGQLIKKGFDAENLDLNIKFFRTLLTAEYIKKAAERYKKQKVSFDEKVFQYLCENIENAVNTYRETAADDKRHINAEKCINAVLKFVSASYKGFYLEHLMGFENCFPGLEYTWRNIKDLTFDKERNIFIEYFEDAAEQIKKKKYGLIAVTVPFIGALIPALTLSRILKRRTKAHITLGGNFLQLEDIKNHPDIFDIYCSSILTGDGEETIIKLAESVKNKADIGKIPGIICGSKKSGLISNPPQPVSDINNTAVMHFKGIDFNEYMEKCPGVYIMVSKGCYWGKCTFCSLGAKYSCFKVKSVDNVISDIKEIRKMHPENYWFMFQDDALSPAFLDKFADKLIQEDLNIYYSIFARFEKQFTRGMLEKLYKSGLRYIYWGLESGSRSMLVKMNKGINLDCVHQILKDAYETGISNKAGIIVNFPSETQQEYNETLEFLQAVEKYVTISPGQFGLMKNSYIAHHSADYGIKITGSREFSYCLQWEDTNLPQSVKEQRWAHFCSCVKNGGFRIDEHKQI